jgi:HAE1 family hydrophobic/amphiphilic exporter-1
MNPDASPEEEAAVIADLRRRLAANDTVNSRFERPTLFSFRTPIEVEVYGDSLDEVYAVVSELKPGMEAVPGLVEIKSSLELGNPELQISFHRDQLTLLGLTLGEVAETVRNKVQGEVATRFQEGDREIDIVVRSVDLGRATRDDVTDMIVGQRDGRPIFLKSIADIRLAEGPGEIRRIGQKRVAVVSGSLSGRDMGAVAAEVRQLIAETAMPAGVTASLSGQEEEREQSLRSMMMAMALAIFLVYLVMASQFESLVHPFIIIFTLPLGAVGVVAALALSGISINIVVMIGVVMLAGIVVNNAIVLIDSVNQKREAGLAREEALVSAGRDRLRPILMTSATTIFGLLPMAIGIGEGAELRAPLAITVIGGLSVATLLTLFVIPVVYSLVDRRNPAPAEAPESAPGGGMENFSGPGQDGPTRPLDPQPLQARSTLHSRGTDGSQLSRPGLSGSDLSRGGP